METCEYCGAEFEAEAAHLEHLADEHRSELGPIDERRVASHVDDDGAGLPAGPLILGGVIVFSLVVVGFVVFGMGSGGGETTINNVTVTQSPGELRSAHEHGTINVTVDGERLDFSQTRYQAPGGEFADSKFHFEGGDGRVWHTHASGVTLEYAMATLGIEAERNGVVIQGDTYTDSGGTSVEVSVNGESVDPASYVLEGVGPASGQGGDHIRIVVDTGS